MVFKALHTCSVLVIMSLALNARGQQTGAVQPLRSVYLNGVQVEVVHPVVSGDVVRTTFEGGAATLHFPGAVVIIPPGSVIRIDGPRLCLDFGTLAVNTGQAVRAEMPPGIQQGKHPNITPIGIVARDLTIVPGSSGATAMEVTRSNGLIAITAQKNNLIVHCGRANSTVTQGMHVTRADAKSDCETVN